MDCEVLCEISIVSEKRKLFDFNLIKDKVRKSSKMSVFTPFANYPLRVFSSPVQVSIIPITLVNDHKKSYLGFLCKLPLTRIQGEFLQTLLEAEGVAKVEVSVSRITIWKSPGYSWADIHPSMVFLISACPIENDDLDLQIAMVVEKWNMARK